MPLIGFLGSTEPAAYAPVVTAFRMGLREKGYEEGKSIIVEYRWAEEKTELLEKARVAMMRELAESAVALSRTHIPVLWRATNRQPASDFTSTLVDRNRPLIGMPPNVSFIFTILVTTAVFP